MTQTQAQTQTQSDVPTCTHARRAYDPKSRTYICYQCGSTSCDGRTWLRLSFVADAAAPGREGQP